MFGGKHGPSSSYICCVPKYDEYGPRYVSIVPTLDFNMYISFIKMHKKLPLNLLMLNILCST
jgi:hypothetical protein